MYLCRGSFWCPCGRNGAMHTASSNSACPGLHQEPLDAAIGQLCLFCICICIALAAARATINKTTMKKYTFFSGLFDGHWGAAVRYYSKHHPMEEVQGFFRSHWTLPPCELFQKCKRKPWGSDRCYLVSHPCIHQSRRRKKDFTSGGLKGTSREALWLILLVQQECVCMCVLKLVTLSRTEKSRSRRVQQ